MLARMKTIGTAMNTESNTGLYRLLAWASPAFPTGAFSYSHGLEAAAADGAVQDRATLEAWIAALVIRGSGRIDADILRDAWRAAAASDDAGLAEVNRRGLAYRATAELALESGQQGAAFTAAYNVAWAAPHPNPLPAGGERERAGATQIPRHVYGEREGPSPQGWEGEGNCHAAAFGAAAARAGISLPETLTAYLQSFAANLMSAGLRLGIVGQTDGQRILAALEPMVAAAVEAAMARGPEDFGAAAFAADLASMAHETQYTRLFRS
jgi:urease accessory protein